MLPAASSFHMFHNQNSFRIIQKSQFQNLHDSFQLGLEIHWTHCQKEIKIPKTKSDKDRKHSNSLTFTDTEWGSSFPQLSQRPISAEAGG
jgi:hypothetical protein